MNMHKDLPEGITLNNKQDSKIELELVKETINITKCSSCEVCFESILLTNNGRHEGIIKVSSNDNPVWKNTLPKDRVRSIKLLDETLIKKLNNHKERHKND